MPRYCLIPDPSPANGEGADPTIWFSHRTIEPFSFLGISQICSQTTSIPSHTSSKSQRPSAGLSGATNNLYQNQFVGVANHPRAGIGAEISGMMVSGRNKRALGPGAYPNDFPQIFGPLQQKPVPTLPKLPLKQLYSASLWHGVAPARALSQRHLARTASPWSMSHHHPCRITCIRYCRGRPERYLDFISVFSITD